ncbi:MULTISPECIES: hypothetical protein [Gordonia]|uniref:Uncharacterized protein n=1 Tax=Gordonia sihwensis NBRC 108236 TaxID=1223544 RepID=L7LNL3_9ACTN|nr:MULTISPECIES: hypothetical protein [Gordonia]AUH67218.1 hypothetical protein CXX93_01090 [Gordonia sp. YC-JH1]GAC61623.1 hypothetical protein GSI01S_19_00870 [Gordonia sihwensis NBRC 108236]
MLDELNDQARADYDSGEFSTALAGFSVLREIRSRREGPYSVKYLEALHNSVRCMSMLEMWDDADLLCSELHSKYVRTLGRGQEVTVDVAKHWAWAMVHRHDLRPATALYLTTADAMWDADAPGARRLIGAAAVVPDARPAEMVWRGRVDGVPIAHTDELLAVLGAVAEQLAEHADAEPTLTLDGLALTG